MAEHAHLLGGSTIAIIRELFAADAAAAAAGGAAADAIAAAAGSELPSPRKAPGDGKASAGLGPRCLGGCTLPGAAHPACGRQRRCNMLLLRRAGGARWRLRIARLSGLHFRIDCQLLTCLASRRLAAASLPSC